MEIFSKHFLKTLILFMVMITLGLLGVFVLGYLDAGGDTITPSVDAGR